VCEAGADRAAERMRIRAAAPYLGFREAATMIGRSLVERSGGLFFRLQGLGLGPPRPEEMT